MPGLRRLATLASFPILVSGCALTEDSIRIAHVPAAAAPIPGAASIRVQVVVNDQRQDKSQVVSHKINGFGSEMAAISAQDPVPVTFGQAVAAELRARGYQVTGTGATPLVLELTVFSHRFKGGFFSLPSEGTVSFFATVKDPEGRELFRAAFTGTHKDDVQVAGGNNAKEGLEGALRNGLQQLMDSAPFHAALARAAAPAAKPAS